MLPRARHTRYIHNVRLLSPPEELLQDALHNFEQIYEAVLILLLASRVRSAVAGKASVSAEARSVFVFVDYFVF